ncbi:MAG TPA: ABC transporter ATP-binding protein [Acidimicrobiales bacterium]
MRASTRYDGPVLEVRGIAKRFGPIRAVRGIDLHVEHGETYGLLGPNGAGKSTSISIIAGLLDPDAGTVEVAGEPMTTRSTSARAAIGLVPQEIAVYPELTARENLRFFGRLYELAAKKLDRRIDEVLDVIGLRERADDRSSEFSGGMKRRLNIGIGLLHRPQLLVLDEPTVGVDPQSRNSILDSVEQLSREGMAVLYTTHYMEEAERLCDRIGIIDQGELKAEGTARQLTASIGEREVLRIDVVGSVDGVAKQLGATEGVASVTAREGGFDVLADDASALVAHAVTLITAAGATISSVEIARPDLEAVFLHVTGKALRD